MQHLKTNTGTYVTNDKSDNVAYDVCRLFQIMTFVTYEL